MNRKNTTNDGQNEIVVKEKKQKLPISFYFSILTTLAFIALTIFSIIKNDYAIEELRYVSIGFIVVYSIILVGIIIYTVKFRKDAKANMHTMKTTAKGFKLTIKVINKFIVFFNMLSSVAVTVMMLVDNNGKGGLLVYLSLGVSIFSLITMILFFIKSGFKARKLVKKEAKYRENQKKKEEKSRKNSK
ncbi:MAG TPA: hypothetical protein GX709_00410 [Clostridiales bacterium]|nr:hypothetical protein [Clostridiales bacterium]